MPDPKQELVLSCLERIVKSPEFAASGRLSAFLRYIVVETLDGRADRLKAYTIALTVFGCSDDFDPQANSLVRVEAMRLRKRLANYYAGPGIDDAIEIRVNRGTYAPVFVERAWLQQDAGALAGETMAEGAHAPSAEEGERAVPPAAPLARFDRRRLVERTAIAAAAASLAALVAVSWHHLPGLERTTTATVRMRPVVQQPSLVLARLNVLQESRLSQADADSLSRELISALGRFDYVKVYAEPVSREETVKAEYRLAGDVMRKGAGLQVTFRLYYAATGQIVWSRDYTSAEPALDEVSRTTISMSVASVLARGTGVILNEQYKRLPPLDGMMAGPACITYGAKYFDSQTLSAFQSVRGCLERSIKMDPRNNSYYAALSLLLTDGFRKGYAPDEPDILVKAAMYANEAISLAPQSSEAHISLYVAHLAEKRYEDAFESGEKARRLNPYSVEIMSRLGAGYVLRGQCDLGMKLLDEVARVVDQGPPWLDFYYFLHAYMTDDLAGVQRLGQRARLVKTPLGVLAKIVLSHRNGEEAEARKWYNHLHTAFPGFAADIEDSLDRLGLIEETRAKLIADLKAAGAIRTGAL